MLRAFVSQHNSSLLGTLLPAFGASNSTVTQGENWACGKHDPETVGRGSCWTCPWGDAETVPSLGNQATSLALDRKEGISSAAHGLFHVAQPGLPPYPGIWW